jgi:hypothetical protein
MTTPTSTGRDGLPTGSNTSKTHDVADPHPATEQHYDRQERPGGANPPRKDIGPNSGKHDGKAPPKPRNVEDEGPRR